MSRTTRKRIHNGGVNCNFSICEYIYGQNIVTENLEATHLSDTVTEEVQNSRLEFYSTNFKVPWLSWLMFTVQSTQILQYKF